MKHVTVYREPGRYAAWPANYGIWSWGDEIVVGFALGYVQANAGFHACDRDKAFVTMQARSLDGGETWTVGPMPCSSPGDRALSADEHMRPEMGAAAILDRDKAALLACPGNINFTQPDFALMCARSGLRAGARSWFYTSYDRCRTWVGPYDLPMFGQTGIAARTDYVVSARDCCSLLLTAAKPDGEEGRVFCARTTDGGKAFSFLSWVTPEPEGYVIMPAHVRLPSGRMLVAVRCRADRFSSPRPKCWIDLYVSDDEGATWCFANRPVDDTGTGGNPPALARLQDGRICLTWGYRDAPFGIRARLSRDDGQSWNEPVVLRVGAGNGDIGYTRTVQRDDGAVVTVYYFNESPSGERYIAATIWEP